jgi:diguanylate cyclase (GGDEF)-like protein
LKRRVRRPTRKKSPAPKKRAVRSARSKVVAYPFSRPLLEKELWMIHEVAALMRQGLTYYEALKLVLKCVAAAVKACRVEIYVVDENDRTLAREIAVDSHGRYETLSAVRHQLSENFDDPFSKLVFGKVEYVCFPALEDKRRVPAKGQVVNVKVPIKASGKVLGVLAVDYSGKERPRSRTDILALLTFATQVGFILENIRLHFEIVQLAFKDELTGQYNYRFWIKRVREEVDRAARYKHVFAIVTVGLDRFSRFNETYGFAMGDRLLRDMGHWFKRSLRSCDLVARLGGDQYGLMLPETNAEGARVVAENILKGVEAFEFAADPGLKEIQSGLTVSIGIVEYPAHGLMIEQLTERATQTLHDAKKKGGNSLIVAEAKS